MNEEEESIIHHSKKRKISEERILVAMDEREERRKLFNSENSRIPSPSTSAARSISPNSPSLSISQPNDLKTDSISNPLLSNQLLLSSNFGSGLNSNSNTLLNSNALNAHNFGSSASGGDLVSPKGADFDEYNPTKRRKTTNRPKINNNTNNNINSNLNNMMINNAIPYPTNAISYPTNSISYPTNSITISPTGFPTMSPNGFPNSPDGINQDGKESKGIVDDAELTELQVLMMKAIQEHSGSASVDAIYRSVLREWGNVKKRDGSLYNSDCKKAVKASLSYNSGPAPGIFTSEFFQNINFEKLIFSFLKFVL